MKPDTPESDALLAQAKQWQADFAQSLFQGVSDDLAKSMSDEDAFQREQRFSIYQNNVFYSLSQALGDLYPSIKKLVGDDFFTGTATFYIRQHPPKKAAMVHFGQSFPEFLAAFEHTKNMPYLTDVAKLELARHLAYHARDEAALTANDFAGLDTERFEHSTVQLHSSFQSVASRFAVFDIWQANHEHPNHEQGEINVDQAQQVLVIRHDNECMVFQVDIGTYEFFKALERGDALHLAAQQGFTEAEKTTTEFDVAAAIGLAIGHGFLTEVIPTFTE